MAKYEYLFIYLCIYFKFLYYFHLSFLKYVGNLSKNMRKTMGRSDVGNNVGTPGLVILFEIVNERRKIKKTKE